jgi:hypothetical protein
MRPIVGLFVLAIALFAMAFASPVEAIGGRDARQQRRARNEEIGRLQAQGLAHHGAGVRGFSHHHGSGVRNFGNGHHHRGASSRAVILSNGRIIFVH